MITCVYDWRAFVGHLRRVLSVRFDHVTTAQLERSVTSTAASPVSSAWSTLQQQQQEEDDDAYATE